MSPHDNETGDVLFGKGLKRENISRLAHSGEQPRWISICDPQSALDACLADLKL